MKLRGGFSVSRRRKNSSNRGLSPSTSMKTPAAELLTQPFNPSSSANRKTKGRNPTPGTAPPTASFSRLGPGAVIDYLDAGSRRPGLQRGARVQPAAGLVRRDERKVMTMGGKVPGFFGAPRRAHFRQQ